MESHPCEVENLSLEEEDDSFKFEQAKVKIGDVTVTDDDTHL